MNENQESSEKTNTLPVLNSDQATRHSEKGVERYSWIWLATSMAAAIALGLGALALIWLFARPFALLILGSSVASALAPIVDWLTRRIPRGFSILVVYTLLILIFLGVGAIIVPPLVGQAQAFVTNAPDLFMKLQQWANQSPFLSNSAISSQFWGEIGKLGSTLVSLPLQFFSSTVDILLVVVISAYWLAVAPELRRFFLSLFPRSDRYHTDKIVEEMGIGMGGYIRGTFIVGAIFGILVYITMLLLGVHFSLMLGVLAGVMEMIPYVGPFISGAAMIAIALAQSPGLALIVLLAAIILQELEGHVLVPIVMRTQTDISPLLAVIVLFAGASIGGLIGALTAIPLAVAMQVLVNRLIAPAIRRRTGAVGPVEEQA